MVSRLTLESMKKALAQIRRARQRKMQPEAALLATILAADDAGCKQDAIADAGGVTQPRVSQILNQVRQ